MPRTSTNEETKALILESVEHEPYSGCWLWAGGCFGHKLKSQQRPAIYLNGEMTRVSKAAYTVFIGAIPQGLLLLHKCDTPMCVNPSHHYPGTQSQNMDDMWKRERHARKLKPRSTGY